MSEKTSKSKQVIQYCRNESGSTRFGIYMAERRLSQYPLHTHEYYELEYVMSGEGECILDGTAYPIAAGDLVFALPSTLHAYSKGGSRMKLLHLSFYDRRMDNIFHLSELHAGVFHNVPKIQDLFDALYEEWNLFDGYSKVAIQNAIERILIVLQRNTVAEKQDDVSLNMTMARKYVMEHFRDPITLGEISEKCGYSPSYFSRCFKQETGAGFIAYLTDIRLDYARTMLRDFDLSVTDACFECGFRTPRSFCRAYTKKFGVPPSKDKGNRPKEIQE